MELFFVLSGRLLADVLVFKAQNLRAFALRRVMRIAPALYVYIAAMVLLGVLGGVSPDRLAVSAAAAGFFYSNYLSPGTILGVFEHSWSLAVEEHSYLGLAVIVCLARRNAKVAASMALGICILMMAATTVRSLLGDEGWRLYWQSDARASSILLSFAIAIQAPKIIRIIPKRSLPYVAPLGVAGSAMLASVGAPPQILYTVGTLFLALSVNLVEHSRKILCRPLQNRILQWFGLVSFSLYLWQQPFYTAGIGGFGLLIAFPAMALLAAASHHYVETPGRRLVGSVPSGIAPSLARSQAPGSALSMRKRSGGSDEPARAAASMVAVGSSRTSLSSVSDCRAD